MPWPIHFGLLAVLALGLGYYLWRDIRPLGWPTRADAQRRLEGDSNLPVGTIQELDDTPFDPTQENSPLWQQHQERLAKAARNARLKGIRATADSVDPYQLRYAVVLMAAMALFMNNDQIGQRLANGFSPQAASGVPITVDLWIDPPSYTGRPPLIISQSSVLAEGAQEQLDVPAGSIVNIRLHGARHQGFGATKAIFETAEKKNKVNFTKEGNTLLATIDLTENAALALKTGRVETNWPIAVIADRPPTIAYTEKPLTTDNNTVRLPVAIGDDYGVADAVVLMQLVADQPRPLDSPALAPSQTSKIVELPLPGLRGNPGPRVAEINLEKHPWAGLQVRLRVKITDGAGQTGETLSEPVTLPEREFYNPVARAIIDERRNLAVAPSSWPRTSRALFAMSDRSTSPELWYNSLADYLLVRTAYYKVSNNNGENIDRMVDEFWPLAMQLEDQELELARRALAAAQNNLREALERGASPQEIRELIEELRTAMQNYIAALAESGQAQLAEGETSEQLESKDLDDMLDDIAKLSEADANDAARQLLAELESMLENMKISEGGEGQGGQQGGKGMGQSSGQSGQGGGQGGQGQSQGSKQLDAAGELIEQQRALTDETYSAARGTSEDGKAPRGSGALQKDQQDIAGDVERLIEGLNGINPEDDATKEAIEMAITSYEEALARMKNANDALGVNRLDSANRAQSEALAALRDGAGAIGDARSAANKANGENGKGEQSGEQSGGQGGLQAGSNNNNLDPLGRPFGGQQLGGQDVGIPDYANPEKARELIEELRRRIAEPGRTKEEIEYLERLLERF